MPITTRGYRQHPPSDEDLIQMQAGQRLKGLLPELEANIGKGQKRITTMAETLISRGELTPEKAVSLWHEYHAYSNVLRTMQNDARLGEAAGERLAAIVNRDGD
jgi:hypothetical protein